MCGWESPVDVWREEVILGALWGRVGIFGKRLTPNRCRNMLLTGTFSRSIDEKSRVAIPKRLRESLAGTDGVLYIAPSTDRSLALYTEESFGQLADRLRRSSPTEQHVRAFTRLFFAAAQQVELDAQGRIRIPGELVQLAALEKEIILLGVQDHLEIWSAERWQAYLADKQARFDEIAEAAFGPLNDYRCLPGE